jgi:trimeric autotransporter adhesin
MRRTGIVLVGLLMAMLQALPALASSAAPDLDGDLVVDTADNCPLVANPFQGDMNGDGIGDRCEEDVDSEDAFEGGAGQDLVFGTEGSSTLLGSSSADHLYGEDGDDDIDGGSGRDFLVGGPGDDTLTGGAACDTFAFDPLTFQIDTITDFTPGLDRFAFTPQAIDPDLDILPEYEFGGEESLEVTFLLDGEPVLTIVFEGIDPTTEIDLDTSPCSEPSDAELTPTSTASSCPFTVVNVEGTLEYTGTTCDNVFSATAADEVFDGGGGSNTIEFVSAGPSMFGVTAGPLGFQWRSGSVIATDIDTDDGDDGWTRFTNIDTLVFDANGARQTATLLTGTNDADTLTAGAALTLVLGFDGIDTLSGSTGEVAIIGGGGADTITAGSEMSLLVGDDVLLEKSGTAANDTINGG